MKIRRNFPGTAGLLTHLRMLWLLRGLISWIMGRVLGTQRVNCLGVGGTSTTLGFSSSKGRISLKADTCFSYLGVSLFFLLLAESYLALNYSAFPPGAGLYYS